MDFNDINRQAEILKKFHLMEPDRKIVSSHKNCNVSAHMFSGKISFDPTLLGHFTDEAILWLLLHEEGHFIYKQEAEGRQNIVMVSGIVSMFAWMILQTFLFISWKIPIFYFPIALVIVFILISVLIFYIDRYRFPEPYYNDEYHSDENAVKGLFLIRPDLISWQIMESSYLAFKDCGKNTKRSRLRKLYLRIMTKPHPPHNLRVQRARAIFNKYNQNKISNFSY